jgi:poly(A) polymerase
MNGTIPKDLLDPDAIKIINRLNNFNFTVYITGGSIRDLLINRLPKDFDISTNATPTEIKKHFRNCRIIGRRFKLAHIFFRNNKIIETSTFRANPKDPKENDNKDLLIRDDNLYGTPEEDAFRRDFTVNGLFYDYKTSKIIDYVGGLEDLEKGILRTIGKPHIRFQEDPVRILRAIRFASQLNFKIEEETYKYLILHSDKILQSSPRRVIDEIWKIFLGGSIEKAIPLLLETKVLNVLLPNLAKTLENEDNLNILLKSLSLIDFAYLHPIMSRTLITQILLQHSFDEILGEKQLKGNIINKIYKDKISVLLADYGLTRFNKDQIHKMLHIISQLGHPNSEKKIPPKLKKRELFQTAFFCWQILWFTRGKIEKFDLSTLLNYKIIKQSNKNHHLQKVKTKLKKHKRWKQ